MRKAKRPNAASLDEIIDELTAEAHDDDERLWNFQQAFQKHIRLPCEGLLWLNPSDNQGVSFLIDAVRAGVVWEDREK